MLNDALKNITDIAKIVFKKYNIHLEKINDVIFFYYYG